MTTPLDALIRHATEEDDPVTQADLRQLRAETRLAIADLRVELLKWNTIVLLGATAVFAEIAVILKLLG